MQQYRVQRKGAMRMYEAPIVLGSFDATALLGEALGSVGAGSGTDDHED